MTVESLRSHTEIISAFKMLLERYDKGSHKSPIAALKAGITLKKSKLEILRLDGTAEKETLRQLESIYLVRCK